MSEKVWKREEKLKIRGKWPEFDLQFVNIAEIWDNIPGATFEMEDAKEPLSTLEYKKMCSFMLKGFTEVPMLNRFQYILRLDDDVCIDHPINYDMFEEMRNARADKIIYLPKIA